MRLKAVFTVAALAVIGFGALAVAQQRPPDGQRGGRGGPPGGGMFGGMFASRMGLLRIPEVRKELDLVDEQVAEIEKIEEELRAKYPNPFGGRGGGPPGGDGQKGRRGPGNNNQGALRAPTQWYFVQAQEQNQQGQGRRGGGGFGGPPLTDEQRAEFEKQRVERAREENAKLAEVLLPEQMKRLTEIYIQVAGVSSLQDEDVARSLGITDAQKTQLVKIRDDFRAKQRELGGGFGRGGGGGGGGDFEAIRAKIMELTKAQDEQTLGVLSAQQKSQFEAMKGKPFAMPEGAGRGGRGGPPGGGERRGGNNN